MASPVLSKSPYFELWTFSPEVTPPPPFGLFPLFGTFFNLNVSLRIQLKVKYVAVTEPENYLSVLLGWVGMGGVVWWGE